MIVFFEFLKNRNLVEIYFGFAEISADNTSPLDPKYFKKKKGQLHKFLVNFAQMVHFFPFLLFITFLKKMCIIPIFNFHPIFISKNIFLKRITKISKSHEKLNFCDFWTNQTEICLGTLFKRFVKKFSISKRDVFMLLCPYIYHQNRLNRKITTQPKTP